MDKIDHIQILLQIIYYGSALIISGVVLISFTSIIVTLLAMFSGVI